MEISEKIAFLRSAIAGDPVPLAVNASFPAIAAAPVAPAAPAVQWTTGFPVTNEIGRIRLQLFDNGTGKRGKVQYVLKVRVWSKSSAPFDDYLPDWTSYVELIDPTKVVAWSVLNEPSNPEIRPERYSKARDELDLWSHKASGQTVWGKMGHIRTSPGKQYFPNEFVTARYVDEALSISLHIRGEVIEFDKFHPNKTNNRKAAVLHAWKDF